MQTAKEWVAVRLLRKANMAAEAWNASACDDLDLLDRVVSLRSRYRKLRRIIHAGE